MEQAIKNYVEGWYDKDPARIEKAMHPLLAKQGIAPDHEAGIRLIDLAVLLEVTPQYGGDKGQGRTVDMRILDSNEDIASAMVISNEYADYMHLVKIENGWQILNVLWEFRSSETLELTSEIAEELEKTLRDYVDGWYDKDRDRVAKSLHPNLAKRSLNTENPGTIDQFTRSSLLDVVSQYGGPGGPGRVFEMEILDLQKEIASVKVISNTFVDYIHLCLIDGQWKILNVLWCWK